MVPWAGGGAGGGLLVSVFTGGPSLWGVGGWGLDKGGEVQKSCACGLEGRWGGLEQLAPWRATFLDNQARPLTARGAL